MNFYDYQRACIGEIQRRRPDYATASPQHQQLLLQTNSPSEWQPTSPTRQAVILIHGLYDSPHVMHSLAEFFQRRNYLVRNLLLPGHGTRAEDLLTVRFEQWLDTGRLAIETLPTYIDRVILCGFSTGSLLSHALALPKSYPKIQALIGFAPALALHPWPSRLLHNPLFVHLAQRFSPWCGQSPVYDYAKYTKHALNGAYQVQRLIDHCNRLPPLDLPVFYSLSASDSVIDSKKVWQAFQRQAHPHSRCLIYSSTPLPSGLANDPRIFIRNSHWPSLHIANFSHIALPIAPDHPHYGQHGDYTEALQQQKPAGQPLILGEVGKTTTVRLTYNPDFSHLSDCLEQFLQRL